MVRVLIAGTDTGVGKTVVTALLAACLRRRGVNAGVMKPVSSGCVQTDRGLVSPDAMLFERALGPLDPPELVNPVRYRAPLAPSVAARKEGRALDLPALDAAFEEMSRRYDVLLVEGVGGLLVPLEGRFTVADLALRWKLPLLVVARPGLGTINHTALTVLHARARDIPVAGFVFNSCRCDAPPPRQGVRDARERSVEQAAEGGVLSADNAACIGKLCEAPFLGSIPRGGADPVAPDSWDRLLAAAAPIADALISRI